MLRADWLHILKACRLARHAALNRGIVVLAACAMSAPTLSQALDLDAVAGRYTKSVRSGFVSGEKYRTDNVLEIVKVSPTSAYIRTRLEFFNGHACVMWGVADIEGDAFVYKGDPNAAGKPCVLSLKFARGRVVFEDKDGACRDTCGMRGGYDGQVFELKTRRPIRYMQRLLASQQYLDAIKEHEAAGSAGK